MPRVAPLPLLLLLRANSAAAETAENNEKLQCSILMMLVV